MGLFSKRKDNKENVTSSNQETQKTEAEKLFEAGKSFELRKREDGFNSPGIP
ncbi:MAG: hypothetical protein LUC38_03360 [Oscillospiraceae bacterium]|nr:hypothetical protein [Ruminococcus sp.]MCD8344980.1 hypothetical protein [Oscillospiraceae bacterium]